MGDEVNYTFTPITQNEFTSERFAAMEAEGWQLINISVVQGQHTIFYCFWRKDPDLKPLATLATRTFPFTCDLCGKPVESVDDFDWHGLGNCVAICPWCVGSGSDETGVKTIEALAGLLAGKMPESLKASLESSDRNPLGEWLKRQMKQFFGQV